MILIADDDKAVRLSISLALQRAGMECLTVSTENETLEAVRRDDVELTVLDMNLTLSTTGRQGIEMLRKIRVLRPEMPVILITAWGTIPLAVEGMNHGATDFLTKPWSNKDLVAKIRKALSAAEQESKNREHIETLDDTEREAIAKALRLSDGNLSIAAQKLGITRQALYRRIEKYGL